MKINLGALVALFLFVAPAHADGLQCTWVYPQGVFAPQARPTNPLPVCRNGDLESTWGACVPLKRT